MDRPLPSSEVCVARTNETLLEMIQLSLQIITIGLRKHNRDNTARKGKEGKGVRQGRGERQDRERQRSTRRAGDRRLALTIVKRSAGGH